MGRPPNADSIRQTSRAEYKLEWQRKKRVACEPKIAVLDFETDPFQDNEEIYPFVCEIYCDEYTTVIWEEKFEAFIDKIFEAFTELEELHPAWIVYAHNGGKFDYMFLLKKLRGLVSFKGRGVMTTKIGGVELRDSMHILPTALRDYKKDDFDYSKLTKQNRKRHKPEILKYLHSDCVYLYELVTHFIDRHGPKLSIGQAAFGLLKNKYKIDSLGEASDEYLRRWFYGGRVECLQGSNIFEGDYVKEDVNSMYPAVMSFYEHPVSADYSVRSARPGVEPLPNSRTKFLKLQCTNYGALVARDENGSLTPNIARGIFLTTIWEFNTAIELGLIRDVKILTCIDFARSSNFANFSQPLYSRRQELKNQISVLPEGPERDELKREDLVEKFLLNNAYGKTAQNPRNFKDHFFTNPDDAPPGEFVAPFKYQDDDGGVWELHASVEGEYCVWQKPNQNLRFNNVATGASITGAARAVLLEKIYHSKNPVYCDTDSLIFERMGKNSANKNLGAWDHECDIETAVICGKKLYGHSHPDDDEPTVKAKGIKNLSWEDLLLVHRGENIYKANPVPSIKKTGQQIFTGRTVSLTVAHDYRSRIFER